MIIEMIILLLHFHANYPYHTFVRLNSCNNTTWKYNQTWRYEIITKNMFLMCHLNCSSKKISEIVYIKTLRKSNWMLVGSKKKKIIFICETRRTHFYENENVSLKFKTFIHVFYFLSWRINAFVWIQSD